MLLLRERARVPTTLRVRDERDVVSDNRPTSTPALDHPVVVVMMGILIMIIIIVAITRTTVGLCGEECVARSSSPTPVIDLAARGEAVGVARVSGDVTAPLLGREGV